MKSRAASAPGQRRLRRRFTRLLTGHSTNCCRRVPTCARGSKTRGERLTIPKDRLAGIADWLIAQLRADSDAVFASPDGEQLTVSLVTDQPWAAYNWYDGDLSSRVEINTDLPVRAAGLIGTLAHETFPGHHLEHTWKEQRLVRELGRVEASVQLINTPEAYISEGLADLGSSLTVDDARWQELFAGLCEQAGIELGADEPRPNAE